MPELPEVEGLRRRLSPLILGKTIDRLEVRDAKLWHAADGLSPDAAAGRSVLSVERHAKVLSFRLDGGLSLLLHLKIAGQVAADTPDGERLVGGHPYPLPGVALPDASTRFIVHVTAGPTLYLNDQRRFAWLRLLPDDAARAFIAAQRYGPDPLDPAFTPAVLAQRLAARKGRPVKAALLDQTCIAGLGNIYADEALHRARIHPMTRAGDLAASDVAALHAAIRTVLEIAVPVGGAIVKGSRAVDDADTNRDFLRAHGRAGALCPNCVPDAVRSTAGDDRPGPRIIRAFLAGRGTYFCAVCQPAPAGFVLPPPAADNGAAQP
jgi:formamidopyrimidine-DNA glycosylase